MRYYPDEKWSDLAAGQVVDELLVGKVIKSEQVDFARRIVAQQLFILLISGERPQADADE